MKELGELAKMFGELATGAYKDDLVPILDLIGSQVKSELETQIGEYQPGIGPFPAMAPLSQTTIEIKSRLGLGKNGPDSPLWATGAFHDDIGYQINRNDLSVEIGTHKDYILYQELGTGKIPPRPIFGPVTMQVMQKLAPQISAAAAMGITGGVWGNLGVKANPFTSRGISSEILP